jgi:hypothetical protein
MKIEKVTFLVTEERSDGKYGALVLVDPNALFSGQVTRELIGSMATSMMSKMD